MPVTDQGDLRDRYAIIPRTLIFLFQGDKVLLLKGGPKKKLWSNLYNGIGGHLERGESVLKCAHRELFEETGLIVDNLWLCGTIMVNTSEKTGVGVFIFKGEMGNRKEQGVLHSEDGDLEWLPVENVLDFPLVEDLPLLLPRIITCQKCDTPFWAVYNYDDDGSLSITFDDLSSGRSGK